MSVFSQPMGIGRFGIYSLGGSAVGAGVGAAMAGRDHRTSGAIVGGAVGNATGLGVSAYHAYGHNLGRAYEDVKAKSAWVARGGNLASKSSKAEAAARSVGYIATRNPNVTSGLKKEASEFVSGVRSMMSMFRE